MYMKECFFVGIEIVVHEQILEEGIFLDELEYLLNYWYAVINVIPVHLEGWND